MFRRAINYILITLIALQSVVAFADVHQFQQAGIEHIAVETHEHQDYEGVFVGDNRVLDAESSAQDDCNHCCHCHGNFCPFLDRVQSNIGFSSVASRCLEYLFSNTPYQDSPDNPPPIF